MSESRKSSAQPQADIAASVSFPAGVFEGERLSGVILDGGSDWQTVRPDSATTLDVRLVLKTQDDALITMTYRGFRYGPPDVMARLDGGEAVDPGSYYFRVAPLFETSAPKYDWLNRVIAVGLGHRPPAGRSTASSKCSRRSRPHRRNARPDEHEFMGIHARGNLRQWFRAGLAASTMAFAADAVRRAHGDDEHERKSAENGDDGRPEIDRDVEACRGRDDAETERHHARNR